MHQIASFVGVTGFKEDEAKNSHYPHLTALDVPETNLVSSLVCRAM